MLQAARELREAARTLAHGSGGPRRYLPADMSLEEFFELLRQRAVEYVVLRWFEALPHVDDNEDIDLLVADDDLAFVHSLLDPRPLPGARPFDVYTVSGLPGSDFDGVPYYPPRFARQILAHAVWLRDLYRVPDHEHHFDSLSYHAVYHKGYASGLLDGSMPTVTRQPSDHDYERVLADLAEHLGHPVSPTLNTLDLHLSAKGLRPPLDTLERLLPRNPWIGDRFFRDEPEIDEVWRGLAIFVLRERAQDQVEEATRELDRQGFEILEVIQLDPGQRESAGHRLRGGNWERGPWPVSGGPPCVYVIAYDVAPRISSTVAERGANLRIPMAKEQLRQRLLQGVEPGALYNPVHSSDNARQALDYLEALGDPAVEDRMRGLSQRLVEQCTFPHPVLRVLPAQGRRAQVAVVDHPVHGPSVCKIFRPGARRFFERELRARTELRDVPETPELLDRGDLWLVTRLYTDDRSHVVRYLPNQVDVQLHSSASRTLARLAVDLHARGLFLLDLSTDNVVSDPAAGLKVLDWEFLQAYAEEPPALPDSYTFRGPPASNASYDRPQRFHLVDRAGNPVFHPAVTGLPIERLIAPRRSGDELRRSCAQLLWSAYLAYDQRRRELRPGLGRSLWRRRLRTARAVLQLLRRGRP